MAVPRNKKSKSNTRSRRSQHDKLKAGNVVRCQNCGEPKLPHRVCMYCGTYNGRQVLDVVES